MPSWTDAERKILAAKLTSKVEDNGKVHWGSGMTGSLCGTFEPSRKEEAINRAKVTCPICIKIMRTRP